MNRFNELLSSNEYLVLDGAMGTMLMAAGLTSGAPPEEWNVLYPDRVQAVHRAYIQAGSNIILTNSFGGSRYRLQLHDLQDRVFELNEAAAANARAAADAAPRLVAVAGSLGPTGELMDPLGTMTFAGARAAFAEQAAGLVAGGADVLWIETMSDLQEVEAAVAGARSVTDLPLAATMSFDTHGRTMMGVTPEEAARQMAQWDLVALGGNCGNGIRDIESVVQAMHDFNPDLLLIAKANAGIPRWVGNDLAYDGTPHRMAEYAQHVRQLGARLIGACCGSTPAHVSAIASALKEPLPADWEATPLPASPAPTGNGRSARKRRRHRVRE